MKILLLPICSTSEGRLYHCVITVLWSTATYLLELTSFAIRGFKKYFQTDVIYTEFSKAFLLVRKLDLLGFPVDLLRWILSYLNCRTQRELFKNDLSCLLHLTSGIPQGSHLGPLLLNLFINDLPSVITHSRVLRFADDVKLCLQYKDTSCQSDLQSDLNNFQILCSDNLLDLNGSKCKVMTFCRVNRQNATYTMNEGSLDITTLVNDLGVLLYSRLKFAYHKLGVRLALLKGCQRNLKILILLRPYFFACPPNTTCLESPMLIVSNMYRRTFFYLP